jgi:hypothetical protein
MTAKQKEELAARLAFAYGGEGSQFHHGDCIGSDAQAAEIAVGLGYRIIAHPGCDDFGAPRSARISRRITKC